MYSPGTRLYVESEGILQGGHGHVVPTPEHYSKAENVLMVQYGPRTAHRDAMQWAIWMDDQHNGILGGYRTIVRPDPWLCPQDWVCTNCACERARHDFATAPSRLLPTPQRLSWSVDAHDAAEEHTEPIFDDLADTFVQVYRPLADLARDHGATPILTSHGPAEDGYEYRYEIHIEQRLAINALITAEPTEPNTNT